jgi:hypothetical protein
MPLAPLGPEGPGGPVIVAKEIPWHEDIEKRDNSMKRQPLGAAFS